jgi:hypothetical protein
MNMKQTCGTLLALLLMVAGPALAVSESERNEPAASAQSLDIDDIVADGVATTGAVVDGVIGVNSGAAVLDLDFYSFEGKAGDVVTIDIDRGWDGLTRVDTMIGLFGPGPSYALLMRNDDWNPTDPGSARFSTTGTSLVTRDSRIQSFRLPVDGVYTVGVSAYPRNWLAGALVSSNTVGMNGDYTLIVSGVTPSVMQISIEIKPGSGEIAPINPKSKGKVPVALLGSSDFNVDDADTASLTFGHSGNESSLSKCGVPGDINGDLFPDLVCHFENQTAHFDSSDEEGILRGRLSDGKKFEGRGWLKVVPVKAE